MFGANAFGWPYFGQAYAGVSGPAAYTLSASPASIAITGAAVTPTVARKLPVSPGSYAITGTAATSLLARKLIASPGTFAITGTAATPKTARLLSVSPGTYAITGSSATPVAGRKLSATPASFTITGSAATPQVARIFSLSPGSFTISGAADKQPTSWILTASPGSVDLSGTDATLIGPAGLAATPTGGTFFHTPIPLRRKLKTPAPKVTFAVKPATVLVSAAPARLTITLSSSPASLNGIAVAGSGRMAVSLSSPAALVGARVSPVPDAFTRKATDDLAELVRDTLCALEL